MSGDELHRMLQNVDEAGLNEKFRIIAAKLDEILTRLDDAERHRQRVDERIQEIERFGAGVGIRLSGARWLMLGGGALVIALLLGSTITMAAYQVLTPAELMDLWR